MSHAPTLRDSTGLTTPTPLPKFQLFILLYIQAAEPITLIYEYGITHGDEKKIGYYAGSINTLFFLTEMVFVFYWGRASDRFGRRPVLLIGLWGLTLSITLFGLSKTFFTLMMSRALSGALNGNIGVMKSMMAEMTDETNQAQTFSFLQLVFAAGVSAASFIGGGLSHPYERFPGVFGWSKFWKDYPFALPCFVSGLFCVTAFTTAFIWLKETLNHKRRDRVTGSYGTSADTDSAVADGNPTAATPLFPDYLPPSPPSIREVLTPRVRIAILNNATIALLAIVFAFLQPLILSTPIPFGGLGLDAPTIGLILGLNGIVSGVFQVTTFRGALREGKIDAAVITVLAIQQVASVVSGFAYGCAAIFITSAAPTRNALGTTTGLSQSLVSLTRAVGPAAASSLFALSLEYNLLGGQFVYIVLIALVLLALSVSSRLPNVTTRASDERGD
ncbi:major facilitator superfamily domain-containing protein [Gautieria morchelliformis]|nr:major facilitator superfamily domain-containing protein [Gautieria morchelliformis]